MYILHDIYLEYGDVSAQIDYIVVTRKLIFIIECKNLYGNIEINSNGDFIRTMEYGRRTKKEGIYSPITQNKRHLELIKSIKVDSRLNSLEKFFTNSDGATGVGLFQDRDDLRFGEPRLAHGNLLARMAILPERSPYDCLNLWGAYTRSAVADCGAPSCDPRPTAAQSPKWTRAPHQTTAGSPPTVPDPPCTPPQIGPPGHAWSSTRSLSGVN